MKNSLQYTIPTHFLFGIALLFSALLVPNEGLAQEAEIQWLSFGQLEDSLALKPKKVFIAFYADWCAYCKKMDKAAFKDAKVVSKLNNEYYAVKMNVESKDTIPFGGVVYSNEIGKVQKSHAPDSIAFGLQKKSAFFASGHGIVE